MLYDNCTAGKNNSHSSSSGSSSKVHIILISSRLKLSAEELVLGAIGGRTKELNPHLLIQFVGQFVAKFSSLISHNLFRTGILANPCVDDSGGHCLGLFVGYRY